MLEVKDATITVGDRCLAERLSFIARDGQMTLMTGAEGSGKTTLLRTLLGFLPVREGFVSVDGELLTIKSAHAFRKMMVYLPQHMEQLRHQLEPLKAPVCEVDRYAVWGDDVQPRIPAEEPVSNLSEEEIVRLAEETLSQAGDKSIVIADEPAARLNYELADRMFALLRQQADAGKTVLVASHHPRAVAYADQIVELRQ